MDKVNFRTQILTRHLQNHGSIASTAAALTRSPCLSYAPPEASERPSSFDVSSMRKLMDGHNLGDRDWLFNLMLQSNLFNPEPRGDKVFVAPDYNQSMEQQREMTMKRIQYLLDHGIFHGWMTGKGFDSDMRKLALLEVIEIFLSPFIFQRSLVSAPALEMRVDLNSRGERPEFIVCIFVVKIHR